MIENVSAIYKDSIRQLTPIYGEREASSILHLLFEDHLGISRIKRLTDANLKFTVDQSSKFQSAILQLLNQVPVQHIIGYEHFLGRQFLVNQHTLIPRPETEELVQLILRENVGNQQLQILDIGTGTGCIAISLELALPNAQVIGWDISEQAVHMARENARILNSTVVIEVKDVLSENPPADLDILVSNPPYIPVSEKDDMQSNVVNYEPESALFVPNDQPLLFYKRIAELGLNSLKNGGKLYFEIHKDYGKAVMEMLSTKGYHQIKVHPDINGKDRMVSATMAQQ